ncbi:hypothetical protein FGO68_gene10876 [Halteria grandinella]|uniref:Uncharacterized protein n=1 Tax=Halteria grandinella TaxID=5974 RepID=A0A8J8N8S4_HALGN|nr:hypothetical protein FGO68_gene10876 [Halteria grandinella]
MSETTSKEGLYYKVESSWFVVIEITYKCRISSCLLRQLIDSPGSLLNPKYISEPPFQMKVHFNCFLLYNDDCAECIPTSNAYKICCMASTLDLGSPICAFCSASSMACQSNLTSSAKSSFMISLAVLEMRLVMLLSFLCWASLTSCSSQGFRRQLVWKVSYLEIIAQRVAMMGER